MEYVGIPIESADDIEHYGVKGAKWGYNKGSRNGKRTADAKKEFVNGEKPTAEDQEYGHVVASLKSMNNLKANRQRSIDKRNAKKKQWQKVQSTKNEQRASQGRRKRATRNYVRNVAKKAASARATYRANRQK